MLPHMRMSRQRINGKKSHPPFPLKVSGDKKKWLQIRRLFFMAPLAVQRDTEQKGFKIRGLEKERVSTGERKRNIFYLMLLFTVNVHKDFWTPRDYPQCWHGTKFFCVPVLRPSDTAQQRGLETAYTPKHVVIRMWKCWIAVSPGRATAEASPCQETGW